MNISSSNDDTSLSQIENEKTLNLDSCIQEEELKQLIDLEQSLLRMLNNRSLSNFIVPARSPPPEEDAES